MANQGSHVLIICPVNVIQNWMAEFNRWLPLRDGDGNRIRTFNVFLLGDTVKTFKDRSELISRLIAMSAILYLYF